MSTTPTTYGEACDHAEAQYRQTGGLVIGGTYMVRWDDGSVTAVDLRVGDSGIARPAR